MGIVGEGNGPSKLVLPVYISTSVSIAVFGIFAMFLAWRRRVVNGKLDDIEFFLTARNTFGLFRMTWGMFAAQLGSYILFANPSYTLTTGWIGGLSEAVGASVVYIFIVIMGPRLRTIPGILSFTDYVERRFGRVMQVFITLIMVFNMGVLMTMEYTGIGDFFEDIVGAPRLPIAILMGVISSVYTAYGGLYVSILTDVAQVILFLILTAFLAIYVAIFFREPLHHPFPSAVIDGSVKQDLGPSYLAYSSILAEPMTCISSGILSEVFWQRCLASKDDGVLRWSAGIGGVLMFIVQLFFAMGGFLAAWSGLYYPTGPDDDGSTVFFDLLNAGGQKVWLITIVAVLAVTCSLCQVDSMQNGLVDSIAGTFLQKVHVNWTRVLVLVLNTPLIIVSLKGYDTNSIFLLAGVLTTATFVPVCLGLLEHPFVVRCVTGFTVLVGCLTGLGSLFVWAAIQQARMPFKTYAEALDYIFIGAYDWPPFIISPVASVLGTLAAALVEQAVLQPLLGSKYPAPLTFKHVAELTSSQGQAALTPSQGEQGVVDKDACL